jgi:hypothetical protein
LDLQEKLSEKITRTDTISRLAERDGLTCQYPGCSEALDLSITDGPFEVTIDHWMPKSWCLANGWTYEQTWDLSNLKLMTKHCNARKGDLVPNEDGTLPEKPSKRKFRYRRQKRATRPELCSACDNGRGLGPDEVCASCSSGPQPERYPRWAKMNSNECDHELFWCAWCSIGVIPRKSALEMIMIEGEGGE